MVVLGLRVTYCVLEGEVFSKVLVEAVFLFFSCIGWHWLVPGIVTGSLLLESE